MKEWQKAEDDFLHALKLMPDQPDVLNYLAYGWLTQNTHLKKAEEMLKIAIISQPNNAYIMDSYGWALYKLKRYDDAVKFLERANLMIPYDPTTNDHLGDIYWKTGRKNEARFQWQRALGFKPQKEDAEKIKMKLEEGLKPDAKSMQTSQIDAE